jgi:hypothetical protein
MIIQDRKPYERRFNSLKQEFESWKSAFQSISKFINPALGFFEGTQPNRGEILNHKELIDSTPTRASRIFTSGMYSGMTSPARPWYKLILPDPDLNKYPPVKDWLNVVVERQMEVFSKSNIYNILWSVYEELGVFSVGAALMKEDYDDVIRGRGFTVGEYFLGTGPDQRVNAFARIVWMTAVQMVNEFGLNNVRTAIQDAYKQNRNTDEWYPVYHLIEENDSRIESKKDFKNMKFRSIYWDPSDKANTVLKVAGFKRFPILAPRWNPKGSNIYSKCGPGWMALGDAKTLQKANLDLLIMLDKQANPPLQANASIRNKGGVNVVPGAVTWHEGSTPDAGVKTAYEVNPNIQSQRANIAEIQQAIKEDFFVDIFLMIAQAPNNEKTMYEVAKKYEEKLTMLGAVLEPVENELLDPLIDISFDIMVENGLLPPPPPELENMPLGVEYVSMLAQAQKMVGITSIEQTAGFVGNLAGVFPEVRDKFNPDEAVDEYVNMLGTPSKLIRTNDEVAQIRNDRAKQQQAAQQQEMMAASIQGAKTLSETDTGSNNALTALLGGVQQ